VGAKPLNSEDVIAAAEQCAEFLRTPADQDWSVRVPDLEWTVWETVAHIGDALLWYSLVHAAGGPDVDTLMDRPFRRNATPAELVFTVNTAARALAGQLACSPPETRGYHGWGTPDPEGYAAMACDELLIHTDDVARTFGATFEPDPNLCARVLDRLFVDVPDAPPWDALRWANGRIALPDHPRRNQWRWYATPPGER
jgi:uncharacterized protein (TIGR03083 family)